MQKMNTFMFILILTAANLACQSGNEPAAIDESVQKSSAEDQEKEISRQVRKEMTSQIIRDLKLFVQLRNARSPLPDDLRQQAIDVIQAETRTQIQNAIAFMGVTHLALVPEVDLPPITSGDSNNSESPDEIDGESLGEETADSDNDNGQPGNTTPGLQGKQSIEKIARHFKFSYVKSFIANPVLHGPDVLTLVIEALKQGGNTNTFDDRMRDVIKKFIQKWKNAEYVWLTDAPRPPVDSTIPSGSDGIGLSQIQSSEEALESAQIAANQGKFKKAVSILSRIPQDDPAYTIVLETMKEYSNAAVKELRSKAAAAFQDSIPITDTQAKRQYLENAKSFLQEAVDNFPHADRIDNMKKHLEFVQKQIRQISGGSQSSQDMESNAGDTQTQQNSGDSPQSQEDEQNNAEEGSQSEEDFLEGN